MNKFKIGDIVVGNDSSNQCYITCKNNNFVGKVVSSCNQFIHVEVLDIDKNFSQYVGEVFIVDYNWFELKKEEEKKQFDNLISLNEVIELIEDDEMLSNKAKRHIIKKIKNL